MFVDLGFRTSKGLGKGLRGLGRGGTAGDAERLETLGAKFKLLDALVKLGVDGDGGADVVVEHGVDGIGLREPG